MPSDILCGGILAALCSTGTHRHSPRRLGALSVLPHRRLVFARRAPARKLLHRHSLKLRHRLRPALCRNDGRTSRMAGTQFTCFTVIYLYKRTNTEVLLSRRSPSSSFQCLAYSLLWFSRTAWRSRYEVLQKVDVRFVFKFIITPTTTCCLRGQLFCMSEVRDCKTNRVLIILG